MPKQKRHKTKYPGVYYIKGRGLKQGTKEKVYYIHFRKNGKLVEEKAGRQFQDKMTPSRASRIRSQKISGSLPLNRDQRKLKANHGSTIKSTRQAEGKLLFETHPEGHIAPEQLIKILTALFRVSTDGLSISDHWHGQRDR